MKELDLSDERIRALLNEVLDSRVEEEQERCPHRKSGTIVNWTENDFDVQCDTCGKLMGEQERKNAFSGVTTISLSGVERNVTGKE